MALQSTFITALRLRILVGIEYRLKVRQSAGKRYPEIAIDLVEIILVLESEPMLCQMALAQLLIKPGCPGAFYNKNGVGKMGQHGGNACLKPLLQV
jgi:hypothetical protein